VNLIKQAGQALATFAPTVATALGGPLAGMAVSSLEKIFGIDPSASPEAKQAAIEQGLLSATPDQIIALKKAENDFQVQMKQLGIQEEQLAYQDVANARSMQVQIRSWTPDVLSYGVLAASTAAFLAVVLGYVHIPQDPATAAIYGSVLTFLVTESKAVLGYWFGTSIGSQSKDDTIATIAKQP